MSHWNNFPACSFMTDFEIVVVQNERARLERERLEQEQLNAQPYNQLQDHHGIEQQQQQINDNTANPLLVNMLSNLRSTNSHSYSTTSLYPDTGYSAPTTSGTITGGHYARRILHHQERCQLHHQCRSTSVPKHFQFHNIEPKFGQ